MAFPKGTPVRVRQTVDRRIGPVQIDVVGIVEAWHELPTGSWFAHGKDDKLWLCRLELKKVDGERTFLVIDEQSRIAKLEATRAKQ